MKLFRRSKAVQPNVPPEVAEYYQAERKQRRGMAWLMTVVTLLVTVAIVVGLFLAGRWVYRTARDHNKPAPAKTAQSGQNQTQSSGDNSNTGDSSADQSSTTDNEAAAPTDSTENTPGFENDSSDTSAPEQNTPASPSTTTPSTPAPSTPSETPAPSTPSTTTPANTGSLSNTGPGDTAMVLFVASSVVAYALYRRKLSADRN